MNTAVVTIRGTRYEFNMEPDAIHRCDPDFFGAFWGIGVSADGSGGNLDLLLPPAGDPAFEDDPPSIKVKDPASDLEWVADPEFVALYAQLEQIKSQVDSWTLDGPTVTGVATFVETNAAFAFVGGVGEEPQPVEGAFEVICAEQ